MNGAVWIQNGLLALIFLAALYYAWRKVMPAPSTRVLNRWARRLARAEQPSWQQWLGRQLQPKVAAAGCDSGCSTCGGCGSQAAESNPGEAVPLTFHRNPRRR